MYSLSKKGPVQVGFDNMFVQRYLVHKEEPRFHDPSGCMGPMDGTDRLGPIQQTSDP